VKRLGAVAVMFSVLIGATGASSSGVSPPPFPARTITVHGPVGPKGGPLGALALNGPHAAYVLGNSDGHGCQLGERVYRLDLATGRSTTVSGHFTCSEPQTSTGAGIETVAAADARTAWLLNEGGNTESDDILFASTATTGNEKALARAGRTGTSPPATTGRWIGGLVSDGTRISYATWTTTGAQAVTTSALWRVSGGSAHVLAQGSGAVVSASADAGRVALLRSDGTVAVYGLTGPLLQTIPVGPAQAVTLSGDIVAVLTKAHTVEVYNRLTGALRHTWPIASGPGPQLSASGDVAVYVTWRSIHALNLLTGQDAIVATAKRAINDAAFDSTGLLYDYNLNWTASAGRIVFTPFTRLAAAVGG
jgi:hypothetical protein